jgi:hypothetical protein
MPERPRVLDERLWKNATPMTVSLQEPFRVGHRDLDRSGRVNHVRHMEWALETAPLTVCNTCALEMLAVDLVGEAMHGEPIMAECRISEDRPATFHPAVRSRSTGNGFPRVITRWRRCQNDSL